MDRNAKEMDRKLSVSTTVTVHFVEEKTERTAYITTGDQHRLSIARGLAAR